MTAPDPHELTPPLRRHPALRPLSREHMGGLIHARDLQNAADTEPALRGETIRRFLEAWHSEIAAHFDDEERLLGPLIRDPVLRERLLSEHRTLRALAEKCESDARAACEPATLIELGRLLHDHIRWEERVLFEAIQAEHPAALAQLEPQSADIESRRPGAKARQARL